MERIVGQQGELGTCIYYAFRTFLPVWLGRRCVSILTTHPESVGIISAGGPGTHEVFVMEHSDVQVSREMPCLQPMKMPRSSEFVNNEARCPNEESY